MEKVPIEKVSSLVDFWEAGSCDSLDTASRFLPIQQSEIIAAKDLLQWISAL